MAAAYLPVTPDIRDSINAYLAGMAARGFTPPPMADVVRAATDAARQSKENSDE